MRVSVLLLGCAGPPSSAIAAAQEPPAEPALAAVLARVGDYVKRFETDLSNIVAEEHYTQEVRRGVTLAAVRELKSDLLLVQPSPDQPYLQFRDVFEVDGRPIRDRSERLQKLFVDPSKSSFETAGRIMAESARYNVGAVNRNINTPVLALLFLHPGTQPRFKFSRGASDAAALAKGLPKSANFAVTTELWMIDYRETAAGTMIRTSGRRDLPSRGRFWVDPASGRVLMTELIAEDTGVFGTVIVSYQSPPLLDFLVPVEMRETYRRPGRDERIQGVAMYTNF